MSKILVIDDERAIRNTLKEVLEYEKHEVDLAEDGPKGIELFSANPMILFSAISRWQRWMALRYLPKLKRFHRIFR